MKLSRVTLSGFRCFGPEPTAVDLDDTTFVLGPNGAGKTSVLHALARMFSLDPAQRRIKPSDFHVPADELPERAPAERLLWIDAEFRFPELRRDIADGGIMPAVPATFAHLLMETEDQSVVVRYRLRAVLDQDGEVEETFTNVIRLADDGRVVAENRVSKQDRAAIQVHYLPARRNPADHISYSANALLGRAMRAARWAGERDEVGRLTAAISAVLAGNAAVVEVGAATSRAWGDLHRGLYYVNPAVSFAKGELENLLRHLTLGFARGHDAPLVDFSRLSDGQQSLLYVALVLGMREVGDRALSGDVDAFDLDKLRPPVFTLLAIEEPENSLSPHYLGRVVRAVESFAAGPNAQTVVATHAPSLLRRVDPTRIRHLRLNRDRRTVVSKVVLPAAADADAAKYVREAVQAFPELYFARLVVLGEGDSEEVVLPRMLAARGMLADDTSVSVVPLGGRHVNHFWRLLNELGIPYVTLLDLDAARYGGGWGRVRYAARQLLLRGGVRGDEITERNVAGMPGWDSDEEVEDDAYGWIADLEAEGVFFSAPLDLDFMMLEAYGAAYDLDGIEDLDDDPDPEEPPAATLRSVLGKSRGNHRLHYSAARRALFMPYHRRFKLGSKPSWHIRAMAELTDRELVAGMPTVLRRMLDAVERKLEELPE